MRILQILSENGKLKKTHLAGRARINYGTCIKYLKFLQRLEWINLVQGSQNNGSVSITSEGIENLSKLKNGKKDSTKIQYSFSNSANGYRSPCLATQNATGQHLKRTLRKKIILIDDDEDILQTYRIFLDNGEFEVRTFSDSRKAFKFLVLHPKSYDVIVLDIRMPQMSGLRLYQGIKASNSDARVIFLSALDVSPELTELFPEMEKTQLLRKPISRDELIEAILATSY